MDNQEKDLKSLAKGATGSGHPELVEGYCVRRNRQ